ncbi:MAG: hypothetical protein ABIL77_00445 [candidate division WOR-3 bacterium]
MRKILVLVILPLMSGCFLGTFRTPEPIGAGNVEKNLYFNFPFYYSRSYKEDARSRNCYYGGGNFGMMLNFGASDNMDFGIKYDLSGGLGPEVKMRFIHQDPLSIMVSGGFGYHFFAEGFSWNLNLIASTRISEYSSIFLGLTVSHLPDYRNLAGVSDYFTRKNFRNFGGLALGFSFRNFRIMNSFKSFNMEFLLPFDKYPPIFWGIGVGF